MEHEIGDVIDYDGVKLEVCKDTNYACKRCYFYHTCIIEQDAIIEFCGECQKSERKLNRDSVYFKELKQ